MTALYLAQATVFHGQNIPTQRPIPAQGASTRRGTRRPDGGRGTAVRSTRMMTGSDSKAVASGLARHVPVLTRHAVGWLGVHDGGLYIDATSGGGGYTRAMLETPGTRVIGIDRDQSAIAGGAELVQAAQGRLELFEQ